MTPAEGATPYPYILILGQDDNERIMGERLRELGAAVQLEHRAHRASRRRRRRSRPRSRAADGAARECTAAWVAGCDGAHSAVRTLSGIDFPGRRTSTSSSSPTSR